MNSPLSDDDISLAQSIADFQLALSAVDFICELEPDQQISRVERRRYRCYEDAATVAYFRPFTQSKGLPTISFKKLGIKPSVNQLELHTALKVHRNKVVAHTDADWMRLALKATRILDDSDILLPRLDFDDGLVFFDRRRDWEVWLRALIHAASHTLFHRLQGTHEVSFVRDHLAG